LDTSTEKEHFQIDSARASGRRLLFTPDSGRLVIVDDKIRWCDAAGGQVIASGNQKLGFVYNLALSADGRTLAVVPGSASEVCSIFRLDATAKTVTLETRAARSSASMTAAALNPDGRLLAIGMKRSGLVVVFDTGTGRPIAQHPSAHPAPVSALTFSGDG